MVDARDVYHVKLIDPRGWIYVTRRGPFQWGWEVRLGGFGFDAGSERTKGRAIQRAEEVVKAGG
jgi:hypothetical protein